MVAQKHRVASVRSSTGATAIVTKKDAQEAGIGLNKIKSGNLTSKEKSLLSDAMALRRGTEQSFSAPKKPTSGSPSSFKELSKKSGAQEARRRETKASPKFSGSDASVSLLPKAQQAEYLSLTKQIESSTSRKETRRLKGQRSAIKRKANDEYQRQLEKGTLPTEMIPAGMR